MSKNFDGISMDAAMRLAQSPEGQELMALLQAGNPQILQSAMNQAASGDYNQVKQTLSAFLASPQVRELLEKIGRNSNE